jgi:hypothetical protein
VSWPLIADEQESARYFPNLPSFTCPRVGVADNCQSRLSVPFSSCRESIHFVPTHVFSVTLTAVMSKDVTEQRQTGLRAVPVSVWALGFVSMFMDISSEMIHGLLPVFLVSVPGASTEMVGLIEDGARYPLAGCVYLFSALGQHFWGMLWTTWSRPRLWKRPSRAASPCASCASSNVTSGGVVLP